jgi:phenylalanyl-tRNA synthetase beta chain
MKLSKNWLNNYFDGKLPDTKAVCDALTFHAFEIDGVDTVGTDEVLDVKVLGDRGHDCLCHRGIAKELSAILKLPLTNDPYALDVDITKPSSEVVVTIEDSKLCKRYIAAHIKGVKVGPSPDWLKTSLEAIGQRSINNVVDATNLVMFNTNQPLHAFDAKRLGSLNIGVRLAKDGEQMQALDGNTYNLKSNQLVITAADRPVGIAGVKGGMADKIDESTTDIFLESATFDGPTIRKSAQSSKLRTDASARFEQELSPKLAEHGMRQVVKLIIETMGGTVEGFVDVYQNPQQQSYVSVTVEKVNSVLGTNLTAADIADVFTRLGLPYKEEHGVFEVQPPMERLDLNIGEDLVEEVGRIIGYDKVESKQLPAPERAPEVNSNFYAAEHAREDLMQKGYSEVLTSVFADQGERVVLNKVDGVRPYLRNSLLPGLTEALAKNKPNKDLLGLKEIKLFEIGTVWKDGKEVIMIGTIGEKEKATEMLLVGQTEATSYESLPTSQAVRYQNFSKYPYIVRDIAMWCPSGTDAEQVKEQVKKEAGELCIKTDLFDRFEKEGRVSLAFRLIFQSFERTLTEVEANEAMAKVSSALKTQGFEIR